MTSPPPTPPTPTPPQPAPASEAPKPTGDEHDPERARALIEKLRPFEKKARDLEKELADARAKLDEHETAKLSETEKLTKQVTDLTAKLADVEQIQARADKYEKALQGHLDALRRDLPKHITELLDGRDPADQLEWLSKNAEQLGTSTGRAGVPATPRANGNAALDRIAENRQKLVATGQYPRLG